MEYVTKINIFGLKMMVKSGLEIFFLKFRHAESLFWKIIKFLTILNTQNMRNSNLVYVSKMEYVHKVNIFGLKMMVKSGLKKIILKFLHAEAIFY